MKNTKRRWFSRIGIAAACSVSFLLSGCSASTAKDAPVDVQFWYSSGSQAGRVVRELVNIFNKEHEGKIKVDGLYQGKYTIAIGKLANSVASGHYPDVMQMNDTNTVYMKDTGITIPAYKLNELYGNKLDVDDLVPTMRNYYTLDGKLWSIPFMTSIPLLYLNDNIVSKAGLDIKHPPTTSDEVFQWAEQIYHKTGKPGLTGFIDPWFFEQFTASEGIVYCTPGNGLNEDAHDFTLLDPRQIKIWNKERELYHNGIFFNTGSSGSHAETAFSNQYAGMALQSSAMWSNAQKKVHFGVTGVPWPINNKEKGGFITGGNSLWVLGKDPKSRTAQAAWEFVRFLSSPKAQSFIFKNSGYLPNNKTTIDAVKDKVDPVRQVMLQALLNNRANTVTGGCHSGAFQAERELIAEALGNVLNGDKQLVPQLEYVKKQAQLAFKIYLHRAALQKKHSN